MRGSAYKRGKSNKNAAKTLEVIVLSRRMQASLRTPKNAPASSLASGNLNVP